MQSIGQKPIKTGFYWLLAIYRPKPIKTGFYWVLAWKWPFSSQNLIKTLLFIDF
jgi:hypothetical protein